MLLNWLFEKLHARANALATSRKFEKGKTIELDPPQELAQIRRRSAIKFIDEERFSEAEVEYQFLIDNNLNEESDFVALGFVLKAQNKIYEARRVLEGALCFEDSKADVHYMLAQIYAIEGLHNLSEKSFDAVLKHSSQFRPAYLDYCALLNLQRKFDQANEIVTLALIHFPSDIEFLIQKGNICVGMKKFEIAFECFRKVVGIDPINAAALSGLCQTSQEMHLNDQALDWIDIYLEYVPNSIDALHERGKILNKLRRYEDALKSLNELFELGQSNYDLFIDLGCALGGLGRLENAMDVFTEAVALRPESVLGYLNSGVIAFRLGKHIESFRLLKKAEEIIFSRMTDEQKANLDALPVSRFAEHSDIAHHATAQYLISLGYLTLGDFSNGLTAYEWRWSAEQFKSNKRPFSSKLWLGGESIAGNSILLFAEQGFGDTLQFVRYVGLVKALGANVFLEVQPTLKKLLQKSTGADQVFCFGDVLPKTDFHCPLMSLPLAFNTTLATIPRSGFSLNVEEISAASVSKWGKKLIGNSLKRVGIAWSGNNEHLGDQFRSIPLDFFAKITSKEMKFYSLQKEVRPTDTGALVTNEDIIDYSAEFSDFLDTASLVYHLDLVITVDTSVAHLAASMGKPVWILLPIAPDWRWMLARTDSPWYPSVTLFRQSQHGVWDDVLDVVAARLRTI